MTFRGVVIEYDFAAIEGAEILYGTACDFLKQLDGIPFDRTVEARYLAGADYQAGLAAHFAVVKTKKTAQKAARDLAEAFSLALDARLAKPLSPAFVNFVRILAEKVKVVISTRANPLVAEKAFAPVAGPNVTIHHEESTGYGFVRWDVWRRTCVMNRLNARSLAVTGSGFGVKAALVAGIAAVAVPNPAVAYQDFSGADAILKKLDAAAARRILGIMRIA